WPRAGCGWRAIASWRGASSTASRCRRRLRSMATECGARRAGCRPCGRMVAFPNRMDLTMKLLAVLLAGLVLGGCGVRAPAPVADEAGADAGAGAPLAGQADAGAIDSANLARHLRVL